jgi:hypothetical protein
MIEKPDAAAVLQRLIDGFFYVNSDGRLEWRYIEGTSVHEIEPDLERDIRLLMPSLKATRDAY